MKGWRGLSWKLPVGLVFFACAALLNCQTVAPPKEQTPLEKKQSSESGESVRRVIREHQIDIRHCFATGVGSRKIEGTLLVEWEFNAEGRVTRTKVLQPFLANVDECVVEEIKTWKFTGKFPQPIVRVQFPFVFSNIEVEG